MFPIIKECIWRSTSRMQECKLQWTCTFTKKKKNGKKCKAKQRKFTISKCKPLNNTQNRISILPEETANLSRAIVSDVLTWSYSSSSLKSFHNLEHCRQQIWPFLELYEAYHPQITSSTLFELSGDWKVNILRIWWLIWFDSEFSSAGVGTYTGHYCNSYFWQHLNHLKPWYKWEQIRTWWGIFLYSCLTRGP